MIRDEQIRAVLERRSVDPPEDRDLTLAVEAAEGRFADDPAIRRQAVRELLASVEAVEEQIAAAVADVVGAGKPDSCLDDLAGRTLLRSLYDRAREWYVEQETA